MSNARLGCWSPRLAYFPDARAEKAERERVDAHPPERIREADTTPNGG